MRTERASHSTDSAERFTANQSAIAGQYFFPVPAASNAIHGAADQKVRYSGEETGDDDDLKRIDPPQDDQLVDDVHDHGHNEDPENGLPAIAQEINPLRWISQQSPKVRWPPCASILQSGPDRQQR